MPQTISAAPPAQRLMEIIGSGLEHHAKRMTELQLGDRSTYVGLSDIGVMQECPRAAVLRKLNRPSAHEAESSSLKMDLRRQLILRDIDWRKA